MECRRVSVAVIALAAGLMALGTGVAAAITGSVTRLAGGTPVAGAVVTAAGPSQPPVSTTTDAGGLFSIDVAGAGALSVGVRADGLASQSVAGVDPGATLPFTLAPSRFTALPAYGGGVQGVAADARSGTFYALASLGPELYRSTDYGGTWNPVTMSYDDPVHGLRSSNSWNFITTSSVSGEVAFAAMGVPNISFSTDFGVTWRTVKGDFGTNQISDAPRPFKLSWSHARPGAPNVLIAAKVRDDGTGWNVWRADLSAAEPAFAKETTDPFGSGSVVAFADSANGSFIGRVDATGALSFAPVAASGPLTFGPPEAAGLPTPPQLLRLGGARETDAPPDGALVVGATGPPVGQMLTKPAGAGTFAGASISSPTNITAICLTDELGGGDPSRASASVAPTSTGAGGAGNVAGCWVTKTGAGPLALTVLDGFATFDRLTYDALWGQGNQVAFSGRTKFARTDAGGVPAAEPWGVGASPGTGAGSGGWIANGIRNLTALDTSYGPDAGDLSVSGDELSLASTDGGATMRQPVAFGGWRTSSNAWWRGASGDWLVFGFAFSCDATLSAQLDWDGVTMLPRPNLLGSACTVIGGPDGQVASVEGVPGSDVAFIGSGRPFSGLTPGHVYRARIAPGSPPGLTDVFSFDPFVGPASVYRPVALSYCPASAPDPRLRDVLFVASNAFDTGVNQGSLVRITGAMTANPAVTQIETVPHGVPQSLLTDVRADCASGTVYAGGSADDPAVPWDRAGLYKSVDGGVTFVMLPLPPARSDLIVGQVTAIGLNPSDPNDVTISADQTGTLLHSADGGATWITVNDPVVSRPTWVHDLEVAGSGTAASRPAATLLGRAWGDLFTQHARTGPQAALVGTASGAYVADVAGMSGLIAVAGSAAGVPRAPVQITPLTSDDDPSVAAPAGGVAASTIFRRANGLAVSVAGGGSWWAATAIPGTQAKDVTPVTTTDSAGRLHVAFARTGRAPGVYVATRDATGMWSPPKRLSAAAGDVRPAVAVSGATVHVVFLRTRGRARGVYHALLEKGHWRAARRVPGTSAADAVSTLGGPAAAARRGVLSVAFVRAGATGGIRFAARRGTRWSPLVRLTKARDTQPTLTVDGVGVRHVVFRRTGQAAGLYELRGRSTWSARRIPDTTPRDVDPAITSIGQVLYLAFARPGGARPGIYYDRGFSTGAWFRAPKRWSGSRLDRRPSLLPVDAMNVAILFDRG